MVGVPFEFPRFWRKTDSDYIRWNGSGKIYLMDFAVKLVSGFFNLSVGFLCDDEFHDSLTPPEVAFHL